MNSFIRFLKNAALYLVPIAVVGMILLLTPSRTIIKWVETDSIDKYIKTPLTILQLALVILIMAVAFFNIYFYREIKERLILASAFIVVGVICIFMVLLEPSHEAKTISGHITWILLIGAIVYYKVAAKKRKIKYDRIEPVLSAETRQLQSLGYEGLLQMLDKEKIEEKNHEGTTYIVETGVERDEEEMDKLWAFVFVRVADKPAEGGFGDGFFISPDGRIETD